MLLTLALAMLLASVFVIGEAVTQPARERRELLHRTLARRRPGVEEAERATLRERVIVPVGASLARIALKLSPRSDVETVRQRLLAAGMRETAPNAFLARKGAATLGGFLLGFLLGSSGGAGIALGFGILLALLGFVVPDFLLSSRIRTRKETVQADLPDALDLLGVSVEAGLGFDAAVSRVAEHMSGPLVDEFALALAEMRIGRSRHEALRAMTERVEAPELASFVRAVIQADQLGMSLSRILRVQAEEARLRRQAAAEEKAMKAPVKMLFPTVLFIFPAMFIVILGPALLNFMTAF